MLRQIGILLALGVGTATAAQAQGSPAPDAMPLDDRVNCAATAVLFNDNTKLAQHIETVLTRQLAEQMALPRIRQGHAETADDWLEAAAMFADGRAQVIREVVAAKPASLAAYEQLHLDCIAEGIAHLR